MPSIGKNLRTFYEQNGAIETQKMVYHALEDGTLKPKDISLREMAQGFMGEDYHEILGKFASPARTFMEAGDAVDASAFSNITGQILFNEIKSKYTSTGFIGEQLTSNIPVVNGNLGTQKIPWISDVDTAPDDVEQGEPYPGSQFQEQYITAPRPGKFGKICRVTMEMIYSDLTSQAIESAQSVGKRVRILKEERILKVVLGFTNNHSWNGTAYNTYQATTPWINTLGSTPLIDWASLNVAEQLLNEMLDPVTGKPIDISPTALLVYPFKKYTAKRILKATDIRFGDGASNTTATYAGNPLDRDYPVLTTKYGYQLAIDAAVGGLTAANARDYWYLGDFPQAFGWRQVFPLRMVQAPPMNPEEFNKDIVLQVKAHEYGVAFVRDPRFVVRMYNG